MTTKSSHPAAAARKKLHAKIAAAHKHADAAKKEAKLAKLHFRTAKQNYKDARRAAKKLRKVVKNLKAELTALAVKRGRSTSRKPASKTANLIAVLEPAPGVASTPAIPVVLPPIVPRV